MTEKDLEKGLQRKKYFKTKQMRQAPLMPTAKSARNRFRTLRPISSFNLISQDGGPEPVRTRKKRLSCPFWSKLSESINECQGLTTRFASVGS